MKNFSGKRIAVLAGMSLLFFPLFGRAQPRDPLLSIGETGYTESDYLDYEFSIAPDHSSSAPTITNQQENAQFIVARSSADLWSVRERAARFHMSSPVMLPQSNAPIPETLWSLDVGGGYGRQLKNGNSVSAGLSLGSDSDKLFYSIHEVVVRATANYRWVLDRNHAWLFFINYSNNRHFANSLPLPGFAYYFYSPTYKVRAVIGYPFISIFYMPAPSWEARLSAYGPRHFSTEIGYRILRPLQTYGRFEWGQESWLPAGREDNSDRLFFDRRRIMGGVRWYMTKELELDTAIGQEFDRRFYENTSSSYHNIPTTTLPNSSFIDARLSYRFGQKDH
jgi:hypothetical protein